MPKLIDLAAALADPTGLESLGGQPVVRTTVAITNAGDGLSAAMKIDPREFVHGETVHVVLECVVQKVRFDPLDVDIPAGDLQRVHILKAGTASVIESAEVVQLLANQKDRIDRAVESAQGIQRLALETVEDPPQREDVAG